MEGSSACSSESKEMLSVGSHGVTEGNSTKSHMFALLAPGSTAG